MTLPRYPLAFVAAFFAFPFAVTFSQNPVAGIPIDTSFTTLRAWESARKEFSEISIAEPQLDSSVRVTENVVYAKPGGRALHLDVYRPADSAIHPAVLVIHGGGWRSGNRHQEAPMAAALARHGYVALTIEYRLSGEAHYPAALIDLKTAVEWIHAHATEYGIDSGRIAAVGPSAGGTLALLLGTTETSARIRAMISIDGVPDLTDPAESGKDTNGAELSAGARWIGFTYERRPDLWRDASPVYHAGPDSPPVLFINSGIPRFRAGRNLMIAKLTVLGIPAEMYGITNTPHTFWLFHPYFEQVSRWVIEFLDQRLRNTPNEHR